MDKKKYPIGAEHYELYEEIGQGGNATVFRAKCLDNNETVAIKVLDFEQGNCDLVNFEFFVSLYLLRSIFLWCQHV